MTLSELLGTNLLAIAGIFGLLWLVSLVRRDASIVDMFWGLGFAVVAGVTGWARGVSEALPILLIVLVAIWGTRLSVYLARRNWGQPEDYRYRAMRKRHGSRFPLVSLFTVFGLQGLVMWIVSLPIQTGIHDGRAWHAGVYVGICLWLAGLFFEAVGDFQLARFKSNPANRGRVMNRGLWRYTRHPNYFGDFLVWWGIFLIAAEPSTWWWIILSPLLMSFLLIRVSGAALLERSLQTRLEGYDAYIRSTSMFVPLPPRSKASTEVKSAEPVEVALLSKEGDRLSL